MYDPMMYASGVGEDAYGGGEMNPYDGYTGNPYRRRRAPFFRFPFFPFPLFVFPIIGFPRRRLPRSWSGSNPCYDSWMGDQWGDYDMWMGDPWGDYDMWTGDPWGEYPCSDPWMRDPWMGDQWGDYPRYDS